jgi:hypothetical protein
MGPPCGSTGAELAQKQVVAFAGAAFFPLAGAFSRFIPSMRCKRKIFGKEDDGAPHLSRTLIHKENLWDSAEDAMKGALQFVRADFRVSLT